MLSSLRRHLGTAGLVISILALVIALAGGAFAAGGSGGGKASASKSKSKRGPRGPRGPKGAPGATGPQGSPGAAGAKGDQGPQGNPGSNGTNGTNGTNGNTVLHGTGAPAAGLGNNGDFYIDTAADQIYGPKTAGAWGSGTSLKGAPGPAGPTETSLPAEKTEVGLWSFKSKFIGFPRTTISFPLSLTFAPAFNFVTCPLGACTPTAACPSTTAAEPKAQAGQLCVYEREATNLSANEPEHGEAAGTVSPSLGIGLEFEAVEAEETARANGTWAVTAP